jgi:hypothetical protein
MGDVRRIVGMPDPSQYAVVKLLAKAIDVLSTNEKYPVSVWVLHGYLAENCAEAKGEQSTTFFSVTVAKALDSMAHSGMLEHEGTGLRLTEHGRWDLLEEGEMRLKKVDDDSGTATKKQMAFTVLPAGSQLKENEAKLRALGVKLTAPELLMEVNELKWSMEEFLEKAGDFAPTLLLIRNGTGWSAVALPECRGRKSGRQRRIGRMVRSSSRLGRLPLASTS